MIDWKKTTSVIPDGVQTLSKMPSKHVRLVYPLYLKRGLGPFVWDENNKRYIDYPCGLGAILLGYAHPKVNEAVRRVLTTGTIFSLPHKMETELAEKLVEIIPSAEMVRFLKTGSEATSAAVRIARAYTGRLVILCAGYHGWHDWYASTTPKGKGTDFHSVEQVEYNDIDKFEEYFENGLQFMFSGGDIAAVIVEPYIFESPKDGFLHKLRKLCDKHGSLLIFDEVVTGFRTLGGSAQAYFDVTPDLTCLGKAMGNGVPISCVCGKKEIMEELKGDCFVSSTFGGDLIGIAAALETIKIIEQEDVIEKIWNNGRKFVSGFNRLCTDDMPCRCTGFPPRTFFEFPTEEHKSLFWQECLKKGVLFGYAQFISYAHTDNEIRYTIDVMEQAMKFVQNHWSDPAAVLEGNPARQTFRLKAVGKARKSKISLRPATEDDSLSVLLLRESKEVRENSFSKIPIDADVHREWFKNRLEAVDCDFYIVYIKGKWSGYVRFDNNVISIALSDDVRNKGYGTKIIKQAVEHREDVTAYIKDTNAVSIKAFEGAGFERFDSLDGFSIYRGGNKCEPPTKS